MAAKVLVVDDDSAVRMLIRLYIERDPEFRVVAEAGGCEEAVVAFRDEHPDIVTMDYQMPGDDGATCIKSLRKEKADIPILAISSAGEEVMSEMLAAGAYGKLDKEHVGVVAPALRHGLDLLRGGPVEPTATEQLREAIARLEREAADELAKQKRIVGKRVDLVAALSAIRVALDNPNYRQEEMIRCIKALTDSALASDMDIGSA